MQLAHTDHHNVLIHIVIPLTTPTHYWAFNRLRKCFTAINGGPARREMTYQVPMWAVLVPIKAVLQPSPDTAVLSSPFSELPLSANVVYSGQCKVTTRKGTCKLVFNQECIKVQRSLSYAKTCCQWLCHKASCPLWWTTYSVRQVNPPLTPVLD